MNIKIPVSWLRQYLKTDLTAKSIANYLTLSGPSVERIEKEGDDLLFDVEVTTNRPDAYSVWGLAREANAILSSEGEKSSLIEPAGLNQGLDPDSAKKLKLNVLIKNEKLCPRFSAIILDSVKIGQSPAFIKNALAKSGIRPINNIVDITNYVMLELGQPMHAFDYDKVLGAKMILRESREGEKIRTLDDQSRRLPKGAIVIEDQKRLIDLCGIMGGANSQINSRTKRVILFVQAYDAGRIRKTTQHLAFRTDAAARFEKGIDLDGIIPALSRSVYLAKKTAGAKIASELIDIYKDKKKPKTIKLKVQKLQDYLGISFETQKAAKILTLLGFSVKTSENEIEAEAPSWRSQDMEDEVDLIEEIARIYGYHNLPSVTPKGQVPNEKPSILSEVIGLKNALKYLGLTEIISYSIISEELLNLSGLGKDKAVELANPLTQQWQYMRPSIIPSHLEIIAQNQNIKDEIRIFEIAKTYIKQKGGLPKQDLILTIALSEADFADIKGLVENIFEIVKRKPAFKKTDRDPILNGSLAAQIEVDGKNVGTLGMVKSDILESASVGKDVAVCQLNLSTLYEVPPATKNYKPIPKFPPVIEDISAVFGKKTLVADILEAVKAAGKPLVKSIEILDIFKDQKFGENKKSVTLRLTFQKQNETPKQEEVTQVRETIIKKLEDSLFAKVRR